MADPEMDEDLFADLYDGEADDPPANKPSEAAQAPTVPEPEATVVQTQPPVAPAVEAQTSLPVEMSSGHNDAFIGNAAGMGPTDSVESVRDAGAGFNQITKSHDDDNDRPIMTKEDGKMFIGGLNWETTDQSLKDYFSQFGEVIECTVMRDGATGRSRGFGFLTFKDPKCVNVVMVKEHSLDGKLIDPKRAIPRDEQERTAKIFVGGVSQEATETDFKEFFMQFGRVLDATLMMDKDTGRPRGFGFVTFDNEAAVDRTLEQPLAIHGKMIEVKRAQPRGNMRDEDAGGRGGKFGRHNQSNNTGENFQDFNQQNQMAQNGPANNNMSPAMMAQYWQRMQQYFQMMQQQMMQGNGMNPGMNPGMMQGNPAMMQQMMANMNRNGGNPQMMQQMANMQGGFGGMQGGGSNGSQGQGQGQVQGQNNGSASPNSQAGRPGFNAQEQLMFEQQKYEQQSMARMQQGNFNGNSTWEGMYDDVPAPAGMSPGPGRGGFGGNIRGGRGGGGAGPGMNRNTPQPAGQAPANAPTGPKNAGKPGANYRGGGRGGHRGRFDPYGRGGGGGGG